MPGNVTTEELKAGLREIASCLIVSADVEVDAKKKPVINNVMAWNNPLLAALPSYSHQDLSTRQKGKRMIDSYKKSGIYRFPNGSQVKNTTRIF